jgi:hypothetical protein
MANLVSPGVSVSVIDESFFVGGTPGTVPLIFITTKEGKVTPDGSGIATGTLKENAEKLFLVSSQRELLQTFGLPDFNSVGGTAQNGNVLNEYGLLAAHSFLGLSNRAYVVRADLDTAELQPRTLPPSSDPANLTYWSDLNELSTGLFRRFTQGDAWEPAEVAIIEGSVSAGDVEPSSGFKDGDIILAADSDGFFRFFIRVVVGQAATWEPVQGVAQPHTQIPSVNLPVDTYWLKTTTPNSGVDLSVRFFDGSLGRFVDAGTVIFETTTDSYYDRFPANQVPVGTLAAFTDVDSPNLVFELAWHNGQSTTVFTTETSVESALDTDGLVINGFDVPTPASGDTDDVVQAINNTGIPNIVATNVDERLRITNTVGRDIDVSVSTAVTGLEEGAFSNFINVSVAAPAYAASFTQPVGGPLDQDLWYDPSFKVDILVNQVFSLIADQDQSDFDGTGSNGTFAGGFQYPIGALITLTNGAVIEVTQTDLGGSGIVQGFTVVLSGTPVEAGVTLTQESVDPGGTGFSLTIGEANIEEAGGGQWRDFGGALFVQPDEPTSPANGDLWVDTLDTANYPTIYRWVSGAWVRIDNADQTTPDGIVFADARVEPSASIDGDAPDPLLYPGGILLWNTRFSSRNVKQWREGYRFQNQLIGDRWVSISGTNQDGSLITGRAAVRKVVAERLASVMATNEELRAENLFFNLIAAPGFPELADEMVSLNIDRRETAFVIADTPFDLNPSSTSLQEWSNSLTVSSENVAFYYPSGLATNLDGSEVVVPASHMTLRTFAFNDQVSYPWFAPAGFQRGRVNNALAVGYVDREDEFVPLSLGGGQRDVLYLNNINPITTFPGRGIVVLGQKTRTPLDSALDRVNVARLINYVRFQAERISEPFLFEPNDTQTRNAVKERYETFLSELVTLRGVFDFLVVCDETNNTPARIDRNELWIDIAISPAKAVEFIYIPIRVRNTGADLTL